MSGGKKPGPRSLPLSRRPRCHLTRGRPGLPSTPRRIREVFQQNQSPELLLAGGARLSGLGPLLVPQVAQGGEEPRPAPRGRSQRRSPAGAVGAEAGSREPGAGSREPRAGRAARRAQTVQVSAAGAAARHGAGPGTCGARADALRGRVAAAGDAGRLRPARAGSEAREAAAQRRVGVRSLVWGEQLRTSGPGRSWGRERGLRGSLSGRGAAGALFPWRW